MEQESPPRLVEPERAHPQPQGPEETPLPFFLLTPSEGCRLGPSAFEVCSVIPNAKNLPKAFLKSFLLNLIAAAAAASSSRPSSAVLPALLRLSHQLSLSHLVSPLSQVVPF